MTRIAAPAHSATGGILPAKMVDFGKMTVSSRGSVAAATGEAAVRSAACLSFSSLFLSLACSFSSARTSF